MLDALLRNEVDVSFSCKTGVCQTCLMRATSGVVSEEAQVGLKDTLVAQNYFLACSCKPVQDLVISLPDAADIFAPAKISHKKLLADDVLQLNLDPSIAMYYHAGQFINLRRSDGLARSYSIASLPQVDKDIELHIKRMKNGEMSNWLFDQAKVGDHLDMQGPIGNCFYLPGKKERNLLLIGTGTGLAPLIGIVRDALFHGHEGEIHLYHGCRRQEGFYKHDAICLLESEHSNFQYHPCNSQAELEFEFKNNHKILTGRANELALKRHKQLSGWVIYLCGVPEMVNKTKKQAYLAGVALEDIYADPFELTELREKPR